MDNTTRIMIVLGIVTFYGSLQVLFNEPSIVRLLSLAVITVAILWADSVLPVLKAAKDALFRTKTI